MNLSHSLRQILSNFNSTYDAAQEISLQTGEPLGTIHKRLSVWLKKDPETWVKIVETLHYLGYRIRIEKMQYIEVDGEKIEVLEVVQEDTINQASLVTTTEQTQWVDSKQIKVKGK